MVNYTERGKTSLIVTVVVVAMVAHLTSADLSSLIHLTAQQSRRGRFERAAFEPPTVTSLKPPDRQRGSSHGRRGISVPSEQSGSHIPPVVASRSPSNSFPKNYKSRYTHVDTRSNQPMAPVATASSRSQSWNTGVLTGRRTLSDTRILPVVPPQPHHLVNGSTVYAPHSSHAPRNRYGAAAGYPPSVSRTYPRPPRTYDDSVVPELPYATNPYSGGGVWGNTDGEDIPGIWGSVSRNPSYPYNPHRGYGLRTDTFGHRISEDLSHLSDKYPSQTSVSIDRRLGDEDVHIIHEGPVHPYNRDHHQIFQNVPKGSLSPTSSGKEINSQKTFWMPPTTHGSHFNSDRTQVPVSKESAPDSKHIPSQSQEKNPMSVHNSQVSSSSPHEDDRKFFSIKEVWQIANKSSWEEFIDFIHGKGIGTDQVLEKINKGATRKEMVAFLNGETSSTTPQPLQVSDSVQQSRIDSIPPSVMAMDNTAHRHSPSRSREGRKRKRNRKNRRRGRKHKENRKAGKKDKEETGLEINYDLIVTEQPTSSLNQDEKYLTRQTTRGTYVSTIQPNLIGDSSDSSMTTKQPLTSHIPMQIMSFEQTTFGPTHTLSQLHESNKRTKFPLPSPTEVVDQHFDLPSQSKGEMVPFTTPASVSKATSEPTLKSTSSIHTFTNSESVAQETDLRVSTRMPTPLPTFKGPRAGSLTLPPRNKPSEVSIISFTVMEIPNKGNERKTVLEDVTPIRKRQNHHQTHNKVHNLPAKKIDNHPRLLSSVKPKKIDDIVVRTPYKGDEKDNYAFPVKGFMIITGIMGALAVFTLVVLISYAIIKCTKQPVVNNYQVSEQKPATQ